MKSECNWIFLTFLAVEFMNRVRSDNSLRNRGDECDGPRGQKGVCTPAAECEFYTKEATREEKRKFLTKPKLCNFTDFFGTNPDVCCIKKKRKSITACESYKNKPTVPHTTGFNIIEGTPADPAEFPFFAALQSLIEKEKIFTCGGVLISKNYVLTAGHCVVRSANLVMVRLGKTSLLDDSLDEFPKIDVGIKNLIPHPEYKVSVKYYDIALIELEEPVESFTFNVWPACLAPENDKDVKTFQIAGFGRTNTNVSRTSNWMNKAVVEEIPFDECLHNYTANFEEGSTILYDLPRYVEASQLCARNRASQANTCQGDSGSGLMHKSGDLFYVYGITSFGPGCSSKIPSIYSRVSSYLSWIEGIVWPEIAN